MPAIRSGQEYPPKSGITVTRKNDSAWRVDIPASRTGGKREQRQFKTKDEAKVYAGQRWSEIQSVGRQAFALSHHQRLDAMHALKILSEVGLTLAQAAQIARKHVASSAPELTVAALRGRFLSEPGHHRNRLVQRRGKTEADLRFRTGAFVKVHGERVVTAISHQVVRDWIGSLQDVSPVSRNNYRRALHAMFAYAVREEICAINPVAKVPAFAVPPRVPVILTVAEADRLVRAAAHSQAKLGLLPYIVIGLFAGLRRAELERLDWSAVKFDRKMITVSGDIAKTGSIRNVRMSENLVGWLLPFEGRHGPITPINFNKRFRRLRAQAGLLNWGGNELRHSFASYFYDLTHDASLTSAQLGHQSGTRLLFEHYRSLVPLGEGQLFFEIHPGADALTAVASI
jgi:integrase